MLTTYYYLGFLSSEDYAKFGVLTNFWLKSFKPHLIKEGLEFINTLSSHPSFISSFDGLKALGKAIQSLLRSTAMDVDGQLLLCNLLIQSSSTGKSTVSKTFIPSYKIMKRNQERILKKRTASTWSCNGWIDRQIVKS